MEMGTIAQNAYENRLEVPSRVGASCPGVGGKGGHQDQEASLQEGNRGQEGKVDELWRAVSDHFKWARS